MAALVSGIATAFTAVSGLFAAGGPLAAGTLLGTVSRIALSVGLSYAANALAPKQSGQVGMQLQAASGGVVPRSFLFGEDAATAGSLVYRGATDAGGHTPNAYYCAVYALSDLPIGGLTGLTVDGAAVTFDPDGTPAADDFGIPIADYKVGSKDYLWITAYDGTQTTPDPFMRTWFGSDADYPYTVDMVGRGVAYVRVVARVNQDLFPSEPRFLFIADGIPFYDPREDTSAGGSGSQDFDDVSTWALRSDPASLIYAVTRGLTYGGAWFYGGRGLGASRLPYDSWAAAMNECDADIDLAGGGTEKQFRICGEIKVSTQPVDAIEACLRCCNGRMAEIGGIYKILVGAPGSAVLSITDDDIVVTAEQTFRPFPNLDGTINGITAQYPEPSEGYELKDAPPLYDTSLEGEDGDRRLTAAVTYDFATSGTQVQRLMKAALAEARRFRQHDMVMPPSCFVVEPLDAIAWTSIRNGYSAKLFLAGNTADGANADQAWSLTETDPADYDWDKDTDEKSTATGTLVVQRPAAQAMVDWAVSGISIVGDGGRVRAGLELGWNPDVDDVNGVQFQVRLASDSSLVLAGETDAWDAGLLDISQNIVGLTNYEVRGRYRPISARTTSWSSWLSATTPDVRVPVEELSTALQAKLKQIDERIPADISILKEQFDQLATSMTDAFSAFEERLGRLNLAVGARYQDSQASVETAMAAIADQDSALALLQNTIFATGPGGSAEGLFRIVGASSVPDGATAAIEFQVRAGKDGEWATASISLAAFVDMMLGTYSQIVLRGDRILFANEDGSDARNLLTIEDGQVVIDGLKLASGSVMNPVFFDGIAVDRAYSGLPIGTPTFQPDLIVASFDFEMKARTQYISITAVFDSIGASLTTDAAVDQFFVFVSLRRDGVEIANRTIISIKGADIFSLGGYTLNFIAKGPAVDPTVSPGTHTYSIVFVPLCSRTTATDCIFNFTLAAGNGNAVGPTV